MKIKMIVRQIGADDGVHVVNYKAGEEYEISEKLAKIFIDNMWAVGFQPVVKPEIKKVDVVEVKKVPENVNNAFDLKKGGRR
jgi:hypothetical protein